MLPSPAPDSCIIYLLRHGATTNNLAAPPLLQGRGVNLPLCEQGRKQARQTSRLLARCPLNAVYSSPLRRARQTAAAIAAPHQLGVQVVEPLTEVDVGAWEQRSWLEISASEAEAYQRFMDDPAVNGYRAGENIAQVFQRVVPAVEQLARFHLGKAVVVVGHNVVNRVLLANVIGLPLKLARTVNQDNCGVTILRYRKEAMKLLTLNSTFHLIE